MDTVVDKELALQEWAKGNPFLTDYLMFDYLGGHNGNCSISPIFQDAVLKTYVNGVKIREYTFALQVTLPISDTTDDVNTQNMFTLRKWQAWVEQMEWLRDYPDFGDKCVVLKIENLNNMPQMAMMYDNGLAKYQFFAKITYREDA